MDDVSALRARIAELEADLAKANSTNGAVVPPVPPSGGGASGPGNPKGKNMKGQKYVAKCPKGMKDYKPEDMAVREHVFDTITRVFKRHGAVTIDTPVMELKSTLTGKYGEDSKLIYDLKDQGGEILALRYDLTVPFARYCASHKVKQIKRYHIARVYRRDRPVMSKGRFREFYQCDFDIAGDYESMLPDAECVKIVSSILTDLNIGSFTVKVNHRKILDGLFEVSGVPIEKFRTISSAVDKLDKEPWEVVREEMIQKGITGDVADNIWKYVQLKGAGKEALSVIETLKVDEAIAANTRAMEGIADMERFFKYCSLMGVADGCVSFDLSLARGLDYYTGVIYEAILNDAQVGSVAGGGRYDELVGMFNKKGRSIPCVGISLGIERLYAVVQKQTGHEAANKVTTQVLVCSGQKHLLDERIKICGELWGAKIRAETPFKRNMKLVTEFQKCESNNIPLCVLFGDQEINEGVVKVRNVKTRDEITVSRAELGQKVTELLESI